MGRGRGHYASRNTVCLILTTLLFGCSILDARDGVRRAVSSAQAGRRGEPTLKERLLEIPSGTMIEVRLLNNQKIRGWPGGITDEGFSLTTVQGDKTTSQKVAFTEVKSFKQLEYGKRRHTLIWLLAGVAALTAMLIIWGIPEGTHPYPR
jgi:hypothetical protein